MHTRLPLRVTGGCSGRTASASGVTPPAEAIGRGRPNPAPGQDQTSTASAVYTSLKGTQIKLDDSDPIAGRYGEASSDRIEGHGRRLRIVVEHDAAVLKT
jgi:hypothetical protein